MTDRLPPTPGQTIGPFFAYGVEYPKMHEVVPPWAPGAVLLSGTVYDGAGDPVPDAMIEIWGAEPDGTIPTARGSFRRDDHTFTGFGRSTTTADGRYEFWTREPGGGVSTGHVAPSDSTGADAPATASGATNPAKGASPARQDGSSPGAERAPFWAVVVFARGLTDRLHTRIYVPANDAVLAADPLLAALSEDRRATLVARRTGDGRLEHDIHLQGEKETVFLTFRAALPPRA